MRGSLLNPTIRLVGGWGGRVSGRGLRGDKARVSRGGHRLEFWTRVVHAYPDDLVAGGRATETADDALDGG